MEISMKPLILLTLGAASALYGQRFPIHFETPFHVGEHYMVTTSASRLDTRSSQAGAIQTIEYRLDFRGSAEVLLLNERKIPNRIVFTVERFTKTQDGMTADLLKSGSVMTEDYRHQPPISLKDGTIEGTVLEAFQLIGSASTSPLGESTDDKIFGTREPKSIGDSWPINIRMAAASLKDTGIVVSPDHLSGTVSLVGRERIAGIDCLSLQAEVRADAISSTWALPARTKLDQANSHFMVHTWPALSDSTPFHKFQHEMTMQIRFTITTGAKFDISESLILDSLWVAPER